MRTEDGVLWQLDIPVAERDVSALRYEFLILRGEKVVRREWGGVPRLFPVRDGMTFVCRDYWREIPPESHLYSSAYTSIKGLRVERFNGSKIELLYYTRTLVFRVQAPQLGEGQVLALVGSQPPLGIWSPRRTLRMNKAGTNEWVLAVDAVGLYLPFEYKYVVIDEKTGDLLRWEEGENRLSPRQGLADRVVLVVMDRPVRIKAEPWRVAGLVVPLFALRSLGSQGVGDMGDLKMMTDWAAKTGMHALQLLPVGDTTQNHSWTDSYPYNCISIYALHPIYIDLRQLPALCDEEFMKAYERERQALNALPALDYERVCAMKREYLHRLYEQEGSKVTDSEDYRAFRQRNEEWLVPYCVFCLLRDEYGTADFRQWPEHGTYRADEVHALALQRERDCGYYAFVQYLLDRQLTQATQYARSHGLFLKGDIPIGISRNSVEAWVEPHLFHMDCQAGAPPDSFSTDGQNWGFPTYDWEAMERDSYRWWIRRFRKMAEYFDAYRIDHVLGFFRIWQIPLTSVHGPLGQFAPALPMTKEEIADYGLAFDRERFTQPYITNRVLDILFGRMATGVKRKYLEAGQEGSWRLRPEYSTQRDVQAAFHGLDDDKSIRKRNGLYRLISNVLFVPDQQDAERFHPRINAMDDLVFEMLNEKERNAFRQLHDDYYYRRHNQFWEAEAMKKLPPLVQATNMLVCAEDLGMVPACVGPVMERLRILSLEIQSMPKTMGIRFGRLEDNPYLSVSTIFTHDMPTLREWWEEDYERAQNYYNEMLGHDGPAPHEMPGSLCAEVIARQLYCPSMLCLISLQDWLSIDEAHRHPNPKEERINVPANPRHYWRYRMHLNIEELMACDELNEQISRLISRSGRK
jgi:4-alpha-glucanotransferase